MAQKDGAIADAFDSREIVRNKNDGLASPAKTIDTIETARLKRNIAHGQHFIHQQNMAVELSGY